MTGETLTLEVEPSTTVERIKEMIEEGIGYPIYRQVVVYASKRLLDGRPLSDYNI